MEEYLLLPTLPLETLQTYAVVMEQRSDTLLAHAQRDTRMALILHALLIIVLIVLWVAHLRFRLFAPLEAVLVRLIFGTS